MTELGREVRVRLGELAVTSRGDTLVVLGLGSCVAVILHDGTAGVGGLAHVLLPSQSVTMSSGGPARAADTAVPLLAQRVCEHGGVLERLVARLVGGATLFADLAPAGTVHVGERNVEACRAALGEAGIPVVAEAVGGHSGRSVWFDVGRGKVIVRSVRAEPKEL